MTEMSETEKKRVADQRASLGEEGLKSKRQRLEKATEDNEVHSVIGLLQLTVTWYKIRHARGQAYYYSRTGTSKTKKIQTW